MTAEGNEPHEAVEDFAFPKVVVGVVEHCAVEQSVAEALTLAMMAAHFLILNTSVAQCRPKLQVTTAGS